MYNNKGLHASALIISPSLPSNFHGNQAMCYHGNQINKYVNISRLPKAIIDSLYYYLSKWALRTNICVKPTQLWIYYIDVPNNVQSHYRAEALLNIQLCSVNNAFLETITN